jgi:hypothetical protein
MFLERKDGQLDVYEKPPTALTLPKELTLEGYHILRGKARKPAKSPSINRQNTIAITNNNPKSAAKRRKALHSLNPRITTAREYARAAEVAETSLED